jgi:hypothetical protein
MRHVLDCLLVGVNPRASLDQPPLAAVLSKPVASLNGFSPMEDNGDEN